MTTEFVCAECGTQIWRPIALAPDEPRLCVQCLWYPGWHEDADLRELLDPTNLVDPAKILGAEP